MCVFQIVIIVFVKYNIVIALMLMCKTYKVVLFVNLQKLLKMMDTCLFFIFSYYETTTIF